MTENVINELIEELSKDFCECAKGYRPFESTDTELVRMRVIAGLVRDLDGNSGNEHNNMFLSNVRRILGGLDPL